VQSQDYFSDLGSHTYNGPSDPTVGDLIITEICGDGADGNNANDNGFMEVWNSTSHTVSLDNVQARYYNTNPNNPTATIDPSGSIAADSYIIITQDETAFNSSYTPATADFSDTGFYFNGSDDGVDIYLTTTRAEIIDQFNDNGVGANPFTWNDDNSFERNSTGSGSQQSNWTEQSSGTGSPGEDNDTPLPITLSEFSGIYLQGNQLVSLSWVTLSENGNIGWNIYRSGVSEYFQINNQMIDGAGTTSEPTYYQFQDESELQQNTSYLYWLESIDSSNNTELFGPVTVDIPFIENDNLIPELPQKFGLFQNQPNPFNPFTQISFALKTIDA
jgi:hypothetical protein